MYLIIVLLKINKSDSIYEQYERFSVAKFHYIFCGRKETFLLLIFCCIKKKISDVSLKLFLVCLYRKDRKGWTRFYFRRKTTKYFLFMWHVHWKCSCEMWLRSASVLFRLCCGRKTSVREEYFQTTSAFQLLKTLLRRCLQPSTSYSVSIMF